MTIKTKVLSFCCIGLMASALTATARADTDWLDLKSTGSSPYSFTVDDTTTNKITSNVLLSCLSDTLHVSLNETWQVTAMNLWTAVIDPGGHMASSTTVVGGLTVGELEGDAYLDSLYGTGFDGANNTDIQDAIWDVLNPGSVNLGGSNSAATKVYNLAENIVAQTTTETSSFYSQFTFYTPTSDQQGWTNGQPQPFMGFTPVPTPEPSSLMLLGTGIVGLAGIVRQRMLAARG